MNKLLLPLVSLFCAALSANAQSSALSEGFEGSDVPPEGWTMRASSDDASNAFKWEQVTYTSDPLKYRSRYTHGGTYAMMVSSGKTTTDGVLPDSWLISPAVTVQSGDVLSFMLAYAPVYNDAVTAETDRMKFAVMVSTTGTDSVDFTETLFEFTPYGETDWRKKAYSLDQFAGKTIYIAFREYGNGTSGSKFLKNRTWIDDVKVGQGSESDLVSVGLLSPVAGPETTQTVSFKYTNTAMSNGATTASYAVNGGDPVTETIDGTACAMGDTLTYTFQTPASLVAGQSNAVKVWVTADNDQVHDNDTLAVNVTIDNVFTLPYEMNSGNCTAGWNYTYHKKSGRNYTGWWSLPDATGEKLTWTYALCAKESILEGQWFALEQGKVNLVFNYTSGTDVPLSLILTDYATGEATTTDVTLSASTDAVDGKVSIDVPADGKYKLGLKPGSEYAGPFVVNSLAISKAVPSDVQMSGIIIESAVTADESHSVTVKVKNNGEQDVTNVPVKVCVDGEQVDEDVIPSIAAGATVEWKMGQQDESETVHGVTMTAGDHEVMAYTALEDDADATNDTATVSVHAYDKPALPYTYGFESDDDNKCWTAQNLSDNVLNWTIGTAMVGNVNWAVDGENAAYMSSVSGAEHNAVLRSPVLHASAAGQVRLSYYYTTRMTASDASDVTDITATVKHLGTDTTVVATCTNAVTDANQGNYRQGYILMTLPEEGDYQIEFLNTGMGHDIVLDKIALGEATDIAIVSAEQTAKSGYNNTADTITVLLANHGSLPIDHVQLTLTTNHDSGTILSTSEYEQTIQPGDTVTCTFDGVDISTPGTYVSVVKVSCTDDEDTFNNEYQMPGLTSYANRTLPYTEDFDTEEAQSQWTLDGTWQTGTYTSSSAAYNGTGAISHHKKAANADGDWAFSGCIEIPAGTYDLSFFYRTYLNGKTQSLYPQNFAFYLGTEPTAEAMTQPLYTSPANVLAYEKRYKRVEQQFTVPEDGKYYLGVKCTSTSPYGVLYLDNIQLYDADKTAPVLDSYETDFSDFYYYDPSTQFVQWQDTLEDVALTATQTIYSAGNPSKELPGAIVSPAFTISENTVITATLEYSMKADDASNLTDDALAQMKTLLYISDADTLGTNSTLLAEGTDVSGDVATVSATLHVQETAPHYFIVKVEGPTNCVTDNAALTYELHSLKLSGVPTGISTLHSLSGKVTLYTANGVMQGVYDSAAQAMQHVAHGVYLLKPADGSNAVKFVK